MGVTPDIKLGFFTQFAYGDDCLLLQGTPGALHMLSDRLSEFVASSHEEWPVHDFALVPGRHPAKLFASRSGMSGSTGFRWRCSPAELPSIQAMLEALVASGSGHQYFDLAGSTAQLVVSANEYPESWWEAHA
jgi:hypothetical protein